jgi:hypothetical protein
MKNRFYTVALLTSSVIALPFVAPVSAQAADDDFYGVIESRPADGAAGVWIIGGRTFTATAQTKLDEDDGPLAVGTCASVDTEGDVVEEIESESSADCPAPSVTPAN